MSNDYLEFFFHEVCRLNTEWFSLEQLFLTKHEHRLYGGRTGNFFAHLHFYLHEGVYLRIAKLFDNDHRVASLPRAIESLGLAGDPKLLDLKRDYGQLKQEAAPIIKQRNVFLAHNNRQIVLSQEALPTPPVDDVRKVMVGICKIVNKMRDLQGFKDVPFDCMAAQTGAAGLLEVWAAGNAALDAKSVE